MPAIRSSFGLDHNQSRLALQVELLKTSIQRASSGASSRTRLDIRAGMVCDINPTLYDRQDSIAWADFHDLKVYHILDLLLSMTRSKVDNIPPGAPSQFPRAVLMALRAFSVTWGGDDAESRLSVFPLFKSAIERFHTRWCSCDLSTPPPGSEKDDAHTLHRFPKASMITPGTLSVFRSNSYC